MLLLTLRFLLNRSDDELTRFGGGANARMGYLFAPSEGGHVPLEDELADDYAEFLAGTELAQVLYWEVRNIAGGRVDLLFSFGTHRFVAETKRELDDASPENLRSYLGQASLYQGSNVTLGVLLALDLTDKSRGVPHFRTNAWVEVVPPVCLGTWDGTWSWSAFPATA